MTTRDGWLVRVGSVGNGPGFDREWTQQVSASWAIELASIAADDATAEQQWQLAQLAESLVR